jgi:hypothetical protein
VALVTAGPPLFRVLAVAAAENWLPLPILPSVEVVERPMIDNL